MSEVEKALDEVAPEEPAAPEPAKKPGRKPAPKAADAAEPALPDGHVRVRVLKHGAGKIFTGLGLNDTYDKGTIIVMPREKAEHYEDRHFVEIEDA